MSTLDVVRKVLEDECGVDPAAVKEDVNLLEDLDIDSLDLLNAAFRLEKDTGVLIPVRIWIAEEYDGDDSRPSHFVVRDLCRYLEEHKAAS